MLGHRIQSFLDIFSWAKKKKTLFLQKQNETLFLQKQNKIKSNHEKWIDTEKLNFGKILPSRRK